MNIKKGLIIIIAFLLIFSLISCGEKTGGKQKLKIFHAGSLTIPFEKLEKVFEEKHPEVDILREAAGSRKCARKISELNKKADIMASADYTVIENLLIPEHADWNISFVTNEMSIMYTEKSKYGDEINENNWHEILLKDEVSVGRSDPNADPCGYRTLLVWQLADKYYKDANNLDEKLKNKDNQYIRPAEVDLLSLLETGELDYLFIYRSVAQQHHGKFVTLPDRINLKTTEYSDFYKNAKVEVSGKKPGEKITKIGAPMVYGITIPKNAENKELAKKFLLFLFSNEGIEIMENNGQPFIYPPIVTGNRDEVPEEILENITQIKQ
ncbi:MAG: tungstate ABC transporter substrate-binding protein WtpA [Candidatus Mcinerneyibacterium aminivorans]|uniref:Tungstate ABC transporter substrate-binding protein WtpA n=1 Tax=Candidatus Mcinerneyibacterium aminivorans TaxID=2703815 RepID=A0A5D0MA05_9BACT|nr:MAG: tungstate ABC transporter substrate-binding protein WtpA [Candidatus Mcinerneyibacterium aminivorans]